MTHKTSKASRWWVWLIGLAGVALVALLAAPRLLTRLGLVTLPGRNLVQETAQVTTLTAISRVESSGSVEPLQIASLAWKTSGQVARVLVQPGDVITAGQVLAELDALSVPANIISAQADLINARKALDDLLNPSALDVANAQKAVADAQAQLEEAQKALRRLVSPDTAYYQDQVAAKLEALAQAQQNQEKTGIGDVYNALQNALSNLEKKTNQLSDAQTAQAQCPGCTRVFAAATGRFISLADAEKEYNDAVNQHRVAELNFQQAQSNSQNAVTNAQDALATAQANLAAAQASPDAIERAQKEAAVAVAQARLADAQSTLERLQTGPDPDDVAAARARLQAAQASADALYLKAPFAGQVLQVNVLPGDPASQQQVAVVIANLDQLHVDVDIDESDINQIQAGDAVSVTLDSLPGIPLEGRVEWIGSVGEVTAGLVRYTVRVTLAPLVGPAPSPAPSAAEAALVRLGATANVAIVTDVQPDALAVPLDAVQSDEAGEYVMRVAAAGQPARVDVVSGALQGDLVILLSGELQPGDQVLLVAAVPASTFGGPGGAMFGGGR